MENTKKIVAFLILIIIVFLGCKNQKEAESNCENSDLIGCNSAKELFVKLPNYSSTNDRFIRLFQVVDTHGVKVNVDQVIHVSSFEGLHKTEAYKEKVLNEYYLTNPIDNYYWDKNYVYIYTYESPTDPKFFVAGQKKDFEFLGGAYIRVGENIYWSGIQLENVDYRSFKTIQVGRKKSEWDATIGKDAESIFSGYHVITKEQANQKYFIDDSVFN